MKQYIILCSTILLGIAIYQLIMGPGEDSVMHTVKDLWTGAIEVRTKSP